MVIAALVCFAILFVAWMLAPTDGRRSSRAAPEVAPDLAALPGPA
jgi:hypothetical protein